MNIAIAFVSVVDSPDCVPASAMNVHAAHMP
jgi:hypothetical protein